MAAKVICPHCLRHLKTRKLPSEGHRVLCPRCGRSFRVTPEMLRPANRTTGAIAHQDTVAVPALVTDTAPTAPPLPALDVCDPPQPAEPVVEPAPAAPLDRSRLLALLILGSLAATMLLTFLLVLYFAAHRHPAPQHDSLSASTASDTDVREEPAASPQPTNSPKSTPPEPPPQPAWLPADAQAEVDAAIERGIRFLRAQQDGEGSWGSGEHHVGLAALPALTLLECGVPADDPCIRRAADHVRRSLPQLTWTYDLALSILFLDGLAEEQDRPLIRMLALRLAAGQVASGGWSYHCPVLAAEDTDKLEHALELMRPASPLDLFIQVPGHATGKGADPRAGTTADFDAALRNAREALPPHLRQLPALQPPGQGMQWRDGSDNSNTQFAILGLWAAGRSSLPLERPLARIVQRFRTSQSPQGGWEYNFNPRSGSMTLTMTCAGLLGLAVGHGLTVSTTDPASLRRLPADPAIEKGFRALAPAIGTSSGWKKGRDRSHTLPAGGMYLMWSLERAGVLYNRRQIEGRDWYDWGAEMIVDLQTADGAWRSNGYHGANPVTDTCFALLFLKRANLAQDLTKKLELIFEGKRIQ